MIGGFNHLEKYESQWEGLSLFLSWKIKKVPNHQPDSHSYITTDIDVMYLMKPQI